MLVKLSSQHFDKEVWRRVLELVAASLGPVQEQGPGPEYVFIKDGLRYAWRERADGFAFIVIEKMEAPRTEGEPSLR